MSDAKLHPESRALLETPVLVHLATVGGDGAPHLMPTWVDLEGDDVVINTVEGRAKTRNLRRIELR